MKKWYAVFKGKNNILSIGTDKKTVMQDAINKANHRWTFQSFEQDWIYLEEDGYRISKIKIEEI